jgi:hypothetical protein
MALNDAAALAVGTLWDGRLQVYAATSNGIVHKTKVSAQAGAPWTEWTTFPPPNNPPLTSSIGPIVCTVEVAGGNVLTFANGGTVLPGPPGSLISSAPTIVCAEQSPSLGTPTGWGGWSAWPETPAGYVLLAGGVLGGQSSASPEIGTTSVTGTGPIQLWADPGPNGGGLQTSMGGGWFPFQPAPPVSGGVLWPLYGPQGSQVTQNQALWLGTGITGDGGGTQPYLTLYITTTQINYTFGGGQEPFAWGKWSEFSPQLPSDTGGVASLAAGVLPEGVFQVFASDCHGTLWTIWQTLIQNAPVWQTAWSKFPLPGGKPLPALNQGNADDTPPSLLRNVLAIAQDITGELQLFAIRVDGTVWTTWKKSIQDGAPWEPWQEF